MKFFLVIALCIFGLTEILSMPVSDTGVQESLSVVPIDSSVQHVLRRETPLPTTENQPELNIDNKEVTKSIARFDDKLIDTDNIDVLKKNDEKIIDESKKEEKNIKIIDSSITDEKNVQPKEAVRSVTIEENEKIIPSSVSADVPAVPVAAIVPESSVQETVVPQIKSAQPVEAVSVDEKIENKPVDTTVISSVKSTIEKSEEAPVVSVDDVKSLPVVKETPELSSSSVVSTPVDTVSQSATETKSVEIPKITARSEIKESEVSVESTPSIKPLEKQDEKKIIPTDRVTRGTEGPTEQVSSVSSSELSSVKSSSTPVVSDVSTPIVADVTTSNVESKKPIETVKSDEIKKIEINNSEEPKLVSELSSTKLASSITPEELNTTIVLEKKEDDKIKPEEIMKNLNNEKSTTDIKINTDEKLENENINVKSSEPEKQKDEIKVQNNESDDTKKELVRSVKDDSSEEKKDDSSEEKKDDELIIKTEIKKDEKSSEELSSSTIADKKEASSSVAVSSESSNESGQEKKIDAKAEELPKPEEFKERK